MPTLSEARYEKKIPGPSRDLPLRDGESLLLGIRHPVTDRMYGLFPTDEKTADEIITMDGSD